MTMRTGAPHPSAVPASSPQVPGVPKGTKATRSRWSARAARALGAGVVAWAALVPLLAHACGACVEDKVAATYDHAVVQRAASSGDVIVFCEVVGPVDRQRLSAATRRVRSIRARSVRVSAEPAAISFALDSAQSPQAAVEAAQRGLPAGTRLTVVRVLRPSAPVHP